MLYAVNSFAYITSPTMQPASVASMIVPDQTASPGRLPIYTVPSAVEHSTVQNNVQSSAGYGTAIAQEAAVLSAQPAMSQETLTAQLRNTYISSFPTLFFAQLMGQGLDETAQSLVVTYETMLSYGEVKYKPSLATRPVENSPMAEFFKTLSQSTANVNPAPVQAAAAQAMRTAETAAAVQDVATTDVPEISPTLQAAIAPVSAVARNPFRQASVKLAAIQNYTLAQQRYGKAPPQEQAEAILA